MLEFKTVMWQSEVVDGRTYFVSTTSLGPYTPSVVYRYAIDPETRVKLLGDCESLEQAIAVCQAHSDSVSAESEEVA